jgi:hypothetical protein
MLKSITVAELGQDLYGLGASTCICLFASIFSKIDLAPLMTNFMGYSGYWAGGIS